MTYVLGLSTHDIGAIRGFYAAFTECFLARDFERMLTLYTDDAIVMPPNHAEISGHVAIREWMESFPKVTRAEFFVDEIDGGSDLAFVRGKYARTPHATRVSADVDMAVSCQMSRPLPPHRHEFSSQHALSVLSGLQVRLVGGTAF